MAVNARPEFDLAVIGGGINGCGIARDAAGRGASVYLCEMNDLASGTSSWSTKLIHGGLRYLEYYEFRLVREALIEREILWQLAPHLIHPLRFVLPHHRGLRPAWLLRLGLFLYDHLGARKRLPATRTIDLAHSNLGLPLKADTFRRGFEYSDCQVDDARLVIATAQDAAKRGAVIEPRVKAVTAHIEGGLWTLTVEDGATGVRRDIHARALVNAGGPWVDTILATVLGRSERARVRLVQGSHIVVPRLYDHDRAYIFQNTDRRIIFVIPYQNNFTLIGTTDRDFHGDPATAAAVDDEVAYLCAAASEYFQRSLVSADVVWKYAGVRPLYNDGTSEAQAATRDYIFELEAGDNAPPLLSIFGGKITTYRRLAEEALDKMKPYIPTLQRSQAWTALAPLPGGDFPIDKLPILRDQLAARYDFLDAKSVARLVCTYGNLVESILGNATNLRDLGRQFGAGLSEAEVEYLRTYEWAQSADDVLWRRTKLGLFMDQDEQKKLDDYFRQGKFTRATLVKETHG